MIKILNMDIKKDLQINIVIKNIHKIIKSKQDISEFCM